LPPGQILPSFADGCHRTLHFLDGYSLMRAFGKGCDDLNGF